MGILVRSSQNINFYHTYVWGSVGVGVIVEITTAVKFDQVHVFGISPPMIESSDPSVAAGQACVSVCTWSDFAPPCVKTSYTNSIVAGCQFAGFVGVGYSCDDPVG
jgi:hypothetical protein